jgi:hypothetical protein
VHLSVILDTATVLGVFKHRVRKLYIVPSLCVSTCKEQKFPTQLYPLERSSYAGHGRETSCTVPTDYESVFSYDQKTVAILAVIIPPLQAFSRYINIILLRHDVTSRKATCSRPDEVNEIFKFT